MEKSLPKNWVETEFKNLTSFVIGGDWGKDLEFQFDVDSELVSCIRGSEIKNWNIDKGSTSSIRKVKATSLEKRALVEGDILIEISGGGPDQPVGRTIYVDKEALNVNLGYKKVCTNFLRLIRLYDSLNRKYVKNYLDYFYFSGEILKYQGGSNNLRNLKYKEFETIIIPLPPLKEQQRIVAKLDTLFTHLENLKTRLHNIPTLLKHFRQAILTQAVTGKLTQEWRKGRELEDWEEVELENVANVIDPQPSHRTPPIHQDAIPYVSIKDVNKKGEVILENARPVSKEVLKEHIKRYDLQEGDFGFGKIGTLGKPFLLPVFEKRKYTLSANIILIQPRSKGNPKFLYYYLNSSIIEQKLREGTNSTSQPAFGIKKARKFPTPNPIPEEQTEIVKRVENLFAKADAIEAQYTKLKEKIDSLPQAILAKAFKGELVPQLPTDGDAKDLLAEIQKLKEEALPSKKKIVKRKTKVKS